MKGTIIGIWIGLIWVGLLACEEDRREIDQETITQGNTAYHEDYIYSCDFSHPYSGSSACAGLVDATDYAAAEKICDDLLVGGQPVTSPKLKHGSCEDVPYNGYCIGPDGYYTFAPKSDGPDVKTADDDCNPEVGLSAAWGCEVAPEFGDYEAGRFICTR